MEEKVPLSDYSDKMSVFVNQVADAYQTKIKKLLNQKFEKNEMKTYKLLGGGIVKGESQKEVVEQLNATSIFGHTNDLKEFMHRTSEACALQSGSIIRTDSFVVFVKDLVDNNFLLEIDE